MNKRENVKLCILDRPKNNNFKVKKVGQVWGGDSGDFNFFWVFLLKGN
jgi:hypothetical protein